MTIDLGSTLQPYVCQLVPMLKSSTAFLTLPLPWDQVFNSWPVREIASSNYNTHLPLAGKSEKTKEIRFQWVELIGSSGSKCLWIWMGICFYIFGCMRDNYWTNVLWPWALKSPFLADELWAPYRIQNKLSPSCDFTSFYIKVTQACGALLVRIPRFVAGDGVSNRGNHNSYLGTCIPNPTTQFFS